MKVLDRYIARELLGPFAFGVAIFVSVFVAGNVLLQVTRLVADYHPSSLQVLKYFVFSLPGYVVLTFPMSMLLSVLLAFGRLSGDAETVAMRMGGIAFGRLMAPVVIVAAAVSLLTISFNEGVVPRASRAAEDLYTRIVGGSPIEVQDYPVVKEVQDGRLVSVTWARRLYPKRGLMEDATYIRQQDNQPVLIVHGRRAVWEGRVWLFRDGTADYISPERVVRVVIPKDRPLRVEFATSPREIARSQLTAEQMTWRQLRERIAYAVRQGMRGAELSELRVQWHNKISLPFACLVFALIGAPLGVRGHRSSTSVGLGLAVFIVFIYYVIWHYLTVVAERGGMNPLLAAWTPDLIGVLVGGALVAKVSRWGH